MRKILLSAFIILVSFIVIGQELPKILPPSPQVFEATKYGDIPINEASGMANITIPITNYSIGNISIPINISYSTSGIRVNQLSSWVGIGWNLNAGGVIARTVKDIPDEDASERFFPTEGEVNNLKNSTKKIDYYSFIRDVARNDLYDRHDTEPDIYNFNFNNISGSFIKDTDGNYKLIKAENNLIITTTSNGFTIIDTNGTKYNFNLTEKTRMINSCTHSMYGDKNYITSWFLTNITALNGDQINFDYKDSSFIYTDSFSQSLSVNSNIILGSAPTCSVPVTSSYSGCSNILYYDTLTLTEITNNRDNTKIIFQSVGDRLDLAHDVYRLNEILILNGKSLIKKTILDQSYIQSNKNWNYENTSLRSNTHKFRLFLNKIYDEKDGNKNNEYSFYYNRPSDLPPRLSYSQDGLGYYNGIVSPSMIPGFKSKALTPDIFKGYTLGDRRSDFDYVTKGILNKVIYPTKGETEFVYEPAMKLFNRKGFFERSVFTLVAEEDGSNMNSCNKVQNFIPTTSEVVDININNYLLVPGYDTKHNRGFIEITNLTTNEVMLELNLALGQSNHIVSFQKNQTYKISINLCNKVKFDHMISRLSFNYIITELVGNNYNGTGVRVFERINRSMNGIEEKQVYYYTKKDNISDKNFPEFSFRNNYKLYQNMESTCGYVTYYDQGYSNLNTFTKSEISSSNNTPIIYTTNSQVGFRFVTKFYGDDSEGGISEKEFEYNGNGNDTWVYGGGIKNKNIDNLDINNGRLISEANYKYKADSSIKVQEKKYLYNLSSNIHKTIRSYQGNTRFTNNSAIDVNNPEWSTVNALIGMDVSAYHINLTCNQLEQKIEKYFFEGKIIESISNYSYENGNCNILSRQETTNSKGEILKTEIKYPQDLVNPTTAEQNLIDNNRLAIPIKTKTFKKVGTNPEKELSYLYTKFNNTKWPGLNLPEKVQTAKGYQPLEDRIIYHDYDDKGNPVEVSKKDGTKIYYVWGYQQTQPIAKIEGYTAAQLASVQSLINIAISESNLDNDRTVDAINNGVIIKDGNEGNLREALRNLRENPNMLNAQVTSFTYDPLIGVTSTTDPRGQTVYYLYDAFNRLESVKDSEGNMVSKNEYHYKN